VDAFMCYKQKCKVVSLNLAHPDRSTRRNRPELLNAIAPVYLHAGGFLFVDRWWRRYCYNNMRTCANTEQVIRDGYEILHTPTDQYGV